MKEQKDQQAAYKLDGIEISFDLLGSERLKMQDQQDLKKEEPAPEQFKASQKSSKSETEKERLARALKKFSPDQIIKIFARSSKIET